MVSEKEVEAAWDAFLREVGIAPADLKRGIVPALEAAALARAGACAGVPVAAVRVCPVRDAVCPHGVGCLYNDGMDCDIEASRADLAYQKQATSHPASQPRGPVGIIGHVHPSGSNVTALLSAFTTSKTSGPVKALVELLDDLPPNESVGAYGGSGQWVEIATVQDLLSALTAGKPEQAVPSEAEAERERIAKALEEEADTTPCSEDAVVVRDCARLVRANFSYEEAERLASTTADIVRIPLSHTAVPSGWRKITEEDRPPNDTDVLMGYWETWPREGWHVECGHYVSTRGGWIHGRVTHWLPLDVLPAAPTAGGGDA